jgi:hypothetical protein
MPKHLLTQEICIETVKNDISLRAVPQELRTPKVCLIAVREHGNNLKDVPEELKTPEMCLLAVQKYVSWGRNLQYVPEKLKTLKVCIASYENDPDGAKKFIPKELMMEVVSKAKK